MKNQESEIYCIALLFLVLTFVSKVKCQVCPAGQVHHHSYMGTRCCYPVDCDPNFSVKVCSQNGTRDTCRRCRNGAALTRRTSSFNIKHCLHMKVTPYPECIPLFGAHHTVQDVANCFCDLERGEHYYKPQVVLGPNSCCQMITPSCHRGHQPTQTGVCEPCPLHTVQDVGDSFYLCRPQQDCAAMNLKVVVPGSSSVETVCEDPPIIFPGTKSRDISPDSSFDTQPTPLSDLHRPSNPSTDVMSPADDNVVLITLIAVLGFLLICVSVIFTFVLWRRGWFKHCVHNKHGEDTGYGGGVGSMSHRDKDYISDDSDCMCTDVCLSSLRQDADKSNTADLKSKPVDERRPCLSSLNSYVKEKHQGQAVCSNGSLLSEPFYNSISHGSSSHCNCDSFAYSNVVLSTVASPNLLQDGFRNCPNVAPLPGCKKSINVDKDVVSLDGCGSRYGVVTLDWEMEPLLSRCGTPTVSAALLPRETLENNNSCWCKQTYCNSHLDGGDMKECVNRAVSGRRRHHHLNGLLKHGNCSSELGVVGVAALAHADLPHFSQLFQSDMSGRRDADVMNVSQQLGHSVHDYPNNLPHHLFHQHKAVPFPGRLIAAVPVLSESPAQSSSALIQMDELKYILPADLTPAGDTNLSTQILTDLHASCFSSINHEPGFVSNSVASSQSGADVSNPACPGVIYTEPGRNDHPTTATFCEQNIPSDDQNEGNSIASAPRLGVSIFELSLPDVSPQESLTGNRPLTYFCRSQGEVSPGVSLIESARSMHGSCPEKRPFAVVKPIQSDQSLDRLANPLDGISWPLATRSQQHADSDSEGSSFPKSHEAHNVIDMEAAGRGGTGDDDISVDVVDMEENDAELQSQGQSTDREENGDGHSQRCDNDDGF